MSTALFFSVLSNQPAVLSLLLAAGADVNTADKVARPALLSHRVTSGAPQL
jgi:hypothetical protein